MRKDIKKKIKNVGKLTIIFTVFCLYFNSFAAIISDNDGSAFVTKSEFDALKKSFNKQIDDYNESIDGKIDGAIASYLSGLSLVLTNHINGFCEITSSSLNYIYGRAYNYSNIDKQLWNKVTMGMTVMGWGGSIVSFKPWQTSGGYNTWRMYIQKLTNKNSNLKGFLLDDDGNVTRIYKNNNLALSISQTMSFDTWGPNTVIGYYYKTTNINGLEINTSYSNKLSMADRRFSANYLTAADMEKDTTYNGGVLLDPVNNKCTGTTIYDLGVTDGDRRVEHLINSLFIMEQRTDEEADISIYNKCDATVYAHLEDEGIGNNAVVECFADPLSDSDCDLSKYSKEYQPIYYRGSTNAEMLPVSYATDASSLTNTHRFLAYIPKIKIKNRISKTEYQSETNGFNKLEKLKNGYMSYTDSKGDTKHPKFYGGIPLFKSENNTEKITFNVRFEPTTTGVNKIRVWIKKYEFPNGNYGDSIWSSTDPVSTHKYDDDLVIVTSNSNRTNTNKYIDIPVNSTDMITIPEPEKGIVYFLRFAELDSSGTCLNSGGKLTLLTDFNEYISQ